MVARCTVWYNVVKPHETLEGVSRTMAAGVSKIWSIADRAEMVAAAAPKSGKRAYKARETIS